MSAPGTFNVSGASFQGRFIVDGRELHIDGQFYQHIGQTQATPVTLTYEAVDDLHGTYEIDQGSSSIGPTELKIKALNTQEKTISLSGTITPPTPSTHQVSGALHIAIHE